MFEEEKIFRIGPPTPDYPIIAFTPAVDTFIVERWQCPPKRPSVSVLRDSWVRVPATYGTALRCDLYTKANWDAMIVEVYGGDESAYIAAHNAAEANGNIVDERDGK